MKFLTIVLMLVLPVIIQAQTKQVTPEELNEWPFLGQGTKMVESHNSFFMKEAPTSEGVMILSPGTYSDKVVVKYDVMTLTPATVLVAILSASNLGDDEEITIPENYDGTMKLWIEDVQSYFYAFRNGSHNFTPFIRKYPVADGGDPALVSLDKNIMSCGDFYSVELGRDGTKLWLKVDGKTILEAKDETPFSGGHIAFRIRGTAGEYAACLIRNLEITTEK